MITLEGRLHHYTTHRQKKRYYLKCFSKVAIIQGRTAGYFAVGYSVGSTLPGRNQVAETRDIPNSQCITIAEFSFDLGRIV